MAKKSGLGKGLDALFLDNETAESSSLMTLRVSDIEPNKDQPRKAFEPNALAELADSIREHGILQPVVVRALPGGVYQIIAGERRWRASRMAGLSEIPAIVIEADDAKVRELALIENLQRQDLTPLEEAEGYRSLMEHSGMTQEEVAARLGMRFGAQKVMVRATMGFAAFAIGLFGVALNLIVPENAFSIVMNLAGIGIAGTWMSILVTHWIFIRRAAQGLDTRPEYRLFGAPYTNAATIIFLLVVIVSMAFDVNNGGPWTLALFGLICLAMVIGWYSVRDRIRADKLDEIAIEEPAELAPGENS